MEKGGGIMAAQDGSSTAQRDENLLQFKHNIFLSHSGAQKSFVEQLCVDIERHGRYPFFDKRRDSLPIGENFPKLIFEAIEQCRVGVVVLSEQYFTKTKWPMLELAALVKKNLIIMPVFLGITCAQCCEKMNHDRWLTIWQGWAKIDSRINLNEWQAALKVFGYTNGISLNEGLDEVKCRGEIVEAICKKVPPKTRWDDSHVQGRSRLCLAIRMKIDGLQLSKSYGARILGVYGMGGIGKTTACKVLCNDYFEEFEGRVCHIEFGIGSKLLMLQEVLKRLTDTESEQIKNFSEDECRDTLKKGLKKKVLLTIDNVYDSQQVVDATKDLLRVGFMQGSIVIVIARSRPQLQNLNLEDCIQMPELEEDDARSLLLYHAAPNMYLKNVEMMNDQLMKLCIERCCFGKGNGINYHYHPLALKVLGGQLGNDPKEWIEKLNELDPFNQYQEEEKDHPIFSILKRSFETLKHEDQLLFMDAAIFLPDQLQQVLWVISGPNNINIFEWLSMVHGKSLYDIGRRLKGLNNKSLLENLGDGSEKIGMHDLWREFAVLKSKGGDFNSRPWIYEKVYPLHDRRREESILSGGGWKSLQRIRMAGVDYTECVVKEINLGCCTNLRVLKLVYVYMETEVLDVSSLKQLKSLEIRQHHNNSSSKLYIPGLGCLRNLVYLNLYGIRTETNSLYEEIGGLTGLHVLHAQHLHSLSTAEKLPDFSWLNLLEDVVLRYCSKADTISGLSSKMTNLKRLNLFECSFLRSCHGVGDLVALEELYLSGSRMLEELPDLGRLKNLLKLDVSNCQLMEALPGLGDLVSLQEFHAYGCLKLAELPDMRKLANLQKMRLSYCPLIKAMPGLSDLIALEELEADYGGLEAGYHDLCKLTKLETIEIKGWSEQGLPCLFDLVNLKILLIHGYGLDELTGLSNLIGLQKLTIDWSCIVDMQCLSNLTALKSLDVSDCGLLERLPDMHKLSRLEELYIWDCGSLRDWKSGSELRLVGADLHVQTGALLQLQTMSLHGVAFTELPDLSTFPQLRELNLSKLEELTSLTSTSPLTALESLGLSWCRSLRALPDLSHLVSLRNFELCVCGVQLTAHEIEKLEAMCPRLELDKSHLPNMELESDYESDDDLPNMELESDYESDDDLPNMELARDAKRLKS